MVLSIWWGEVLCYWQYNKICKDFYYNRARVSVLEDQVEDAVGLRLEMTEEGSAIEQITAAFQNTKSVPAGTRWREYPGSGRSAGPWKQIPDSGMWQNACNFRISGPRVLWGLVECGRGGALWPCLIQACGEAMDVSREANSVGKQNQEPLENINFSRGMEGCEESKPRLSPAEDAVSWIIWPKTLPTKNKTWMETQKGWWSSEARAARRVLESVLASLKMKCKAVSKLQAGLLPSRKRPYWPQPQAQEVLCCWSSRGRCLSLRRASSCPLSRLPAYYFSELLTTSFLVWTKALKWVTFSSMFSFALK